MIQLDEKEYCCGCSSCSLKCPTGAIRMQADEEGFLYPNIDAKTCVDCGICERACPIKFPVTISECTEVYACYRKDFEKRLRSASGGIFAVLAEEIIAQGGKVFGAAFDENFCVYHRMATDEESLSCLLGSKYVQSEMQNTFAQVQAVLASGDKVLFSGTPCQVQGLKRYLGKMHDDLITVDLICHGVSSPQVWKDYLHEISGEKRIISFIPRDKSDGISNAPLVFRFDDGSILKERYSDNVFIRGFSRNLYLRPSCYACSFKGIERCSDITLGDFWGLEKYSPEFGDHFGISCALLHTDMGRELFSHVKEKLFFEPALATQIVPANPNLVTPVEQTDKRKAFFKAWGIKKMTVMTAVSQTLRPGLREISNGILRDGKYYFGIVLRKIRDLLGG